MKRLVLSALMALPVVMPAPAAEWSPLELLGGKGEDDSSNILSNIIEGVLTKSDINVSDLEGEWTVNGSAVSFKSENALAKAGGVAAAATIESKLDPYYKQYGLTGALFNFDKNGNFSLKVKTYNITGTVVKNDDKSFEFTFKALGIPLGSFTAYIQKSPTNLDIMFDATKLKSLIAGIAKFSGSSMAQTASALLDSYDGLCVGFSLKKQAAASDGNDDAVPSFFNKLFPSSSNKQDAPADVVAAPANDPSEPSEPSSSRSQISSGFSSLFVDILGRIKK